ncbi:MAG: hypothetical protein GWP03_03295 [Proteobacteria bacterium]|nr:hypothetical protein [Pseudomonadota bacterium]
MNYLFALIMVFNIGGYIEYSGLNWKTENNFPYTCYEKLNINISENYSKSFIKANFGYMNYDGKTRYDLVNYIPPVFHVPGFSIPYTLTSEPFLRNGYVGLKWNIFYISLGKQQMGWGTGYAYNPTNLFQYKTIMDMNEELDGVNSVKLKINFPFDLSLETVMLPGAIIDSTSFAGKIKGYFPLLDFSTGFAYYIQTHLDSLTLNPVNDRYKSILADFSTNIFNFNIYGEGLFNLNKKAPVAVIGCGYTGTDNSFLLNFEYLYNGYGAESNYNIADWLDFLSGYELSLGKHELIFNVEKSYNNEYVKFNLTTLVNPIDKTGLILPGVNINPNDNSTIVLTPFIPYGKDDPSNGGTEYTNFPIGWQFRIKVNF